MFKRHLWDFVLTKFQRKTDLTITYDKVNAQFTNNRLWQNQVIWLKRETGEGGGYVVEQQLLGLWFDKSRRMHALPVPSCRADQKDIAVQGPITWHHSLSATPGDATPGTFHHDARQWLPPISHQACYAHRRSVCLSVMVFYILSAHAYGGRVSYGQGGWFYGCLNHVL